jgi:hypothetical protein
MGITSCRDVSISTETRAIAQTNQSVELSMQEWQPVQYAIILGEQLSQGAKNRALTVNALYRPSPQMTGTSVSGGQSTEGEPR